MGSVIATVLATLAPLAVWAVLYIWAEYSDVSLKPLRPILKIMCWALWAAGTALFLIDSPWRHAAWATYWGALSLLGWLKRRYFFETRQALSAPLTSLLNVPQPTYVAVRDVAAASTWYAEKFGMRKLAATPEIPADRAVFQFNEETQPIILVPKDPLAPRPAPVLYTRKIGKALEALSARGVRAGQVQHDRQGTRYFELLDGEGNPIEVSEQP